jgi:hypothetical protein
VHFKPVFIAALFLAELAEPPETLKTLGFHPVGEMFGRSEFGFWHFGG